MKFTDTISFDDIFDTIINESAVQVTEEFYMENKPYINDAGILIIPFNSDKKYHWWNGGQSVEDTLKELNAPEEVIKKYISPFRKEINND